MTAKSIQQRAEEYLQSESYCNEEKPKDIARDAYTAGATDERRELMEVILEIVGPMEKHCRVSDFACDRTGMRAALLKHAELIAKLRKELK